MTDSTVGTTSLLSFLHSDSRLWVNISRARLRTNYTRVLSGLRTLQPTSPTDSTVGATSLLYFQVKSSTRLHDRGLTSPEPGRAPINWRSVWPSLPASGFRAISPQALLRAVFHQPRLSSTPSFINPISPSPLVGHHSPSPLQSKHVRLVRARISVVRASMSEL